MPVPDPLPIHANAKPDGTIPCSACGAALDPLRAGQVAITDGGFRYFCDARCKAAFFAGGARSVVSRDVATAVPPAVAVRSDVLPAPEPPSRAVGDDGDEPPPSSEAAPVVPSSRTDEPADEPVPWVVVGGAIAGLLSVAVRLVSPTLDVAELPLALGAAAACVWTVIEHGGPDRRLRIPSALGVVAAAALATWAHARGMPQASSALALAGVGAACALAVDLVVRRATHWVDRARGRLVNRLPVRAMVVHEGGSHETGADDVRVGQQVLVETGAAIPVDGTVVGGEATVRPWPDAQCDVSKREGDAVVAGAVVLEGNLRVTTTWSGLDRAWLRAMRASVVDPAASLGLAARAVSERGAPLAAVLVAVAGFATSAPLVDVLAAIAAAVLAMGTIGPAAAVAVRTARGHLAALEHGIVYADASAFDRAGQVDVAVACGRGTVLLGEPEIVAIEPFGALGRERILELATGVLTGSSHPFATAVARASRVRGLHPEPVRNPVHAGSGATASLATGDRVVVGRRAFLLADKVSVAVGDAQATELESQGRSVLYCALAGKLVGLLALQDGIKAGARAAVQRLLDARIEPVLLSGDARETCETIGRALEIEHVRPEVALEDRGEEVRALAGAGRMVAVIGHPARDGAALGAANVSVALGAAGASQGEWSVTLASEDVRDAAIALTLAQHTRDRARVAVAVGLIPAVLGAVLVGVAGAAWVVAPVLALVGSIASVIYAKE